jgi:hypothetical protein
VDRDDQLTVAVVLVVKVDWGLPFSVPTVTRGMRLSLLGVVQAMAAEGSLACKRGARSGRDVGIRVGVTPNPPATLRRLGQQDPGALAQA